MTLEVAEFIRRFLLHVLPKGFHRIRHYGLLAGTAKAETIAKARELLAAPAIEPRGRRGRCDGARPAVPLLRRAACIIIEIFEPGCQPQHRPTTATAPSGSTRHDGLIVHRRSADRRSCWLRAGCDGARSHHCPRPPLRPPSPADRTVSRSRPPALGPSAPPIAPLVGPRPLAQAAADAQIPIALAAPSPTPLAGSLYGALSSSLMAPLFSSFFVRSGSPFLRPDPRTLNADARRGCQGRALQRARRAWP